MESVKDIVLDSGITYIAKNGILDEYWKLIWGWEPEVKLIELFSIRDFFE